MKLEEKYVFSNRIGSGSIELKPTGKWRIVYLYSDMIPTLVIEHKGFFRNKWINEYSIYIDEIPLVFENNCGNK
jgi:hypothetical protein